MMKKKRIVSIISTIVFTVLFILTVLFAAPSRKYAFPLDENKIQIVIVGDSIFCNSLGNTETLAAFLEKETGCEMQNCSVGGTCASKLNNGKELDYYSDKLNFYNVSDTLISGNPATFKDDVKNLSIIFSDANNKMKFLLATDLKKADYLIVNYGINDAFLRVPSKSDDPEDEYTYAGAMRHGIRMISEKYPDLKIIIPEVTYTTLIQGGERDEYYDSKTAVFREEYNKELVKIADEFDNVYYFEVSGVMDINDENFAQYLCDGIHYNDYGKETYAKALAAYMEEIK